MNEILTEKQYQHFIIDYLKENNGYVVRKDKEYDRLHAMDREMLFKFLNDTQPDEMDALRKVYKLFSSVTGSNIASENSSNSEYKRKAVLICWGETGEPKSVLCILCHNVKARSFNCSARASSCSTVISISVILLVMYSMLFFIR